MIKGEGTKKDVSVVASPDQFDSFPPSHGPKSDGGDASPASLQYSSCGESEFDRYCSANSVMGTPSMCSSVGTFNDCVDSEFGSLRSFGFGDDGGLENFFLGGNEKLSSSSAFNSLGDHKIRFCQDSTNGEMGADSRFSGLELYDNDGISTPNQGTHGTCTEAMPVLVENGLELLGVSHSNENLNRGDCSDDDEEISIELKQGSVHNVRAVKNVDARLGSGSHCASEVEEGSSSHMDNEAKDDCLHGLDSQTDMRFEGRESDREEDGTSSKFENSEDDGSMYNYGSDDENRNNSYVQRTRHHCPEANTKNENPLLINSSVAFGSEDWDDFEQETGGSTLASMTLDRFQEHEKQKLEHERSISLSPALISVQSLSAGHIDQGYDEANISIIGKQVQVVDELPKHSAYDFETAINLPNLGELEQVEEVRDIHVASYVVQGADELAEDGKSFSSATLDFQKFSEPAKDVRDTFLKSSLVCGADFTTTNSKNYSGHDLLEKVEAAEMRKVSLELDTLDSGVERRHETLDIMENFSITENLAENQESANFNSQLDPLSDGTVNQICSRSTESQETLGADFFEHRKPIPSSLLTESKFNLNWSPAPAHLFDEHHVPVKKENPELNEIYDEVVNEMEEILLDTGESPVARFPQGNRLFQSQLSLPQRDGGSTASTSGTDDPYPPLPHAWKIDGIEVIGAKQKKGDVSLSERLVGVKEYTVYVIRVWSGKDQWEVERRYRDFFTLYRRLKSLFTDQGWNLPSSWSSVERESRKIFGNVSPDVVAERSVLIQECLCSILHSRSLSSPPSVLIWFLSPQDSFPSSPASDTLVSRPSFFGRGTDIENVSSLGKTISLIVEVQPYKSVKQLLEAQHHTCAGCHKYFHDGMSLVRDFVQTVGWGKPRLCEYTGQLFCSSCHTNETAVLPARVLHHWDFTHYPVSQLAKSYLDSINDQPMLCVSAVNPFLFSKVPPLLHVMGLRRKIGTMFPYIRCPFRRSINRGLGSRKYLLESNDFFALRDLIDLSKGPFSALPVMVETLLKKILEHITEQCLICCDVGTPCSARQACNDPSSLIFPFQEDEVEKCTSCKSVFHKPCFKKLRSCHCGANLRANETAGAIKKLSPGGDGGDAGGGLDLLGGGFLSGLFSKAKPERTKEPKESDTVILMGSLPSNSL